MKPAHVDVEEWAATFGRYASAVAAFNRTIAEIATRLRQGGIPTAAQHEAAHVAQELLMSTRTTLLELYNSAPGTTKS